MCHPCDPQNLIVLDTRTILRATVIVLLTRTGRYLFTSRLLDLPSSKILRFCERWTGLSLPHINHSAFDSIPNRNCSILSPPKHTRSTNMDSESSSTDAKSTSCRLIEDVTFSANADEVNVTLIFGKNPGSAYMGHRKLPGQVSTWIGVTSWDQLRGSVNDFITQNGRLEPTELDHETLQNVVQFISQRPELTVNDWADLKVVREFAQAGSTNTQPALASINSMIDRRIHKMNSGQGVASEQEPMSVLHSVILLEQFEAMKSTIEGLRDPSGHDAWSCMSAL